jgi:transposase
MTTTHSPSTPTRNQCQLFVGIDIAATTATAAWRFADGDAPGGRPLQFAQTSAGYALLQQRLATIAKAKGLSPQATLVVMEATGNYWMVLAATLHGAGYAVSVVNPAQAHHFAQARLQHAKNDPPSRLLVGPHLLPFTSSCTSALPIEGLCWTCVSR